MNETVRNESRPAARQGERAAAQDQLLQQQQQQQQQQQSIAVALPGMAKVAKGQFRQTISCGVGRTPWRPPPRAREGVASALTL